jgi:hypothetical protein
MQTEEQKIKDFQDRASKAKEEIDKVLKKHQVTIGAILEYKPQGIVGTCELLNTKEYEKESIIIKK